MQRKDRLASLSSCTASSWAAWSGPRSDWPGGWARDGANVTVLMGRQDGPLASEAQEGPLYRFIAPHRWAAGMQSLSLAFALVSEIRRARPDVLFCAGNTYAIVAVLARLFQGRTTPPIICKVSNSLQRTDFGPVMRGLYSAWLRIQGLFIGHFVALSDPARAEIEAGMGVSKARVHVVHDPHMTDARPLQRRSRGEGRLYLGIGRLAPQKDFGLLIRAFAIAADQNDRLVILGDGPQRKRLERLASACGVAGQVAFEGHCADTQAWLDRADALVLSSLYEGLPAVVVEALSRGTKVVATDCTASMGWLLGYGRLGLLAPTGQAQALAIAMRAVHDRPIDEALRRERVASFSLLNSAGAYLDLMGSLASRSAPVARSQTVVIPSARPARLTAGRLRLGRAALAPVLLFCGCAAYAPLPLATTPPLRTEVSALGVAPSETLTVDRVVTLALENNPDLKAIRLRRGVAQAQLTQAGILPNPTLSGSFLPLLSGAGSVPAWSLGLSQNIKALITYKAHVAAARQGARQVDAEILWQEWQVAGQARQLTARLILGARGRASYVAAYDLLSRRVAQLERALAAGDATLATVAPDRIALEAARAALDAQDQQQLALSHQLNALLGLAPDTVVRLAANLALPPFDPAEIRGALASLPDRRPDLLALRFGYAQADQQVREAVLAQFPDLTLGVGLNSDNAKVINGGPNVSLGLPIFDRGQGAVAGAQASRAQLQAQYAARLAAVVGEVEASLTEMQQLSAQLQTLRRELPAALLAADRAAQAFAGGDLDERAYVDLVTRRFAREQEIATLELTLLDRRIALQTLIGAGLPSVSTLPENTAAGRS